MALLSKLKSILGLERGRPSDSETSITVERERGSDPDASTERAVKEAAAEPDAEAEPGEEADSGAAGPGSGGEPVDSIKGIGPAYAERLSGAGVETVDELAAADPSELAAAIDVSESRVAEWIERARAD